MRPTAKNQALVVSLIVGTLIIIASSIDYHTCEIERSVGVYEVCR